MKGAKILSGILLVLVCFFSLCNYLGYQIVRGKIRHDVKQKIKSGLDEQDLITFSFTKYELKKITWEKEDEFLFQGHFYDVVSKSNSDGQVILKTIGDFQEENLFEELDELSKKELNNKNTGKSLSLLKQLTASKYIFHKHGNLNINFKDLTPINFQYLMLNSPYEKRNTTPPPRLYHSFLF